MKLAIIEQGLLKVQIPVFYCKVYIMEAGGEFYSWYVVYCVVNAFFGFTAVMLNITTIHAIRKTSSLPKPLKTMLLSLAVSDLGVGLLVQPLFVAILAMEMEGKRKDNPSYNKTYLAYANQSNFFSFASLFGVTTLSADRFLAIHLHLRYQELVTHKRVVAVVISVWTLSAVLSLVRLCTPVNVFFAISAIVCVTCLIIVAFVNYKIYMAVRRHAHQIQALLVQQAAQNGAVANVGRVKKSAVATIYIYLVFLLCYLPSICMSWVIATSSEKTLTTLIMHATISLLLLNSSLNPLIYCWKMRHIRHAVMNTLRNAFSSQN